MTRSWIVPARRAALAALLAVACTRPARVAQPTSWIERLRAAAHGSGLDTTVRVAGPGALEQTLWFSDPSPAAGDTIFVRAVAVNRGADSVVLETRWCGLGWRGGLKVHDPPGMGRLACYSRRRTFAPGDSAWEDDFGIVSSPPGSYDAEVQHLVQPESWLPIRVVVRPAGSRRERRRR